MLRGVALLINGEKKDSVVCSDGNMIRVPADKIGVSHTEKVLVCKLQSLTLGL